MSVCTLSIKGCKTKTKHFTFIGFGQHCPALNKCSISLGDETDQRSRTCLKKHLFKGVQYKPKTLKSFVSLQNTSSGWTYLI